MPEGANEIASPAGAVTDPAGGRPTGKAAGDDARQGADSRKVKI